MKPSDLTGQKFGRLTVQNREGSDIHGKSLWRCQCDCGSSVVVIAGNLKSGHAQSCGCIFREKQERGVSYSAEYRIWLTMIDRCYNPKNPSYSSYGGRGITVSDEWRTDFEAFYRDMGPRPSKQHSIDREKNDEGYSKGNCRWATKVEQANNRSNTLFFTYAGQTKTLAEWCRDRNMNYALVYHRMKVLGWKFEEAIQAIEVLSIEFDGETKNLQDWCEILGLKQNETYLRVLRGEAFEDIVKNS